MGRASKTGWGMEGKAVAPAALALTGSKSTNHARKIARASRSSARAVRRFCSILSSSAPRTPAMARCSFGGGILTRWVLRMFVFKSLLSHKQLKKEA